MAGTVTATEARTGTVKKLTFAWTCDAAGAADGASTFPYDGKVICLTTIPSGAAAPTDNYDITVVDADGHDVLLGAGANRDTLNTESVADASLGAVANSALTLHVTNAGNAKQGTVVLYVR